MSYHHLTGLLTRGMAVLAHVCTYGPQGMLPPIDAAMHCSILGTCNDHMLTHHFLPQIPIAVQFVWAAVLAGGMVSLISRSVPSSINESKNRSASPSRLGICC